MTVQEGKEMFKRIYPEREISCSAEMLNDKKCLITGDFPDGTFYFVAEKNTLSCSYNSRKDAIKREAPELLKSDIER